jgi:hypothetical protein
MNNKKENSLFGCMSRKQLYYIGCHLDEKTVKNKDLIVNYEMLKGYIISNHRSFWNYIYPFISIWDLFNPELKINMNNLLQSYLEHLNIIKETRNLSFYEKSCCEKEYIFNDTYYWNIYTAIDNNDIDYVKILVVKGIKDEIKENIKSYCLFINSELYLLFIMDDKKYTKMNKNVIEYLVSSDIDIIKNEYYKKNSLQDKKNNVKLKQDINLNKYNCLKKTLIQIYSLLIKKINEYMGPD